MSGTDDSEAAEAAVAAEVTVGQRLQAERQRQGLSTSKAADGIHLDAWAIDALESGDYSRFGPAVYAKGHLKRYADLLRLPSAEILAAFDPRSSDVASTEQPGSSMRMSAAAPPERALPQTQIAAGTVLLLIIVGVLWWKPWHPRSAAAPAERAASAAAAAPPVARAASPATAAPTGTALVEAPATTSAATTTSVTTASGPARGVASVPTANGSAPADSDPSAGLGRARLRLTCSADSWVDVHDAAGRRVYAGNCRAHSVRTFAGSAPLRIHLGAASGVQMDVNNRPVPIPAQFILRNAADFAAGADGVLRALPSGAAPTLRPRG